jgi:hypothetical protein
VSEGLHLLVESIANAGGRWSCDVIAVPQSGRSMFGDAPFGLRPVAVWHLNGPVRLGTLEEMCEEATANLHWAQNAARLDDQRRRAGKRGLDLTYRLRGSTSVPIAD